MRPPVTEVNLTFWFEPIYTLAALHLSSLRNLWADELPKVEEKAPLAPWRPTDSITFVEDKWPMPACIFASDEREKQVLIQSDRIGLTWYFTDKKQYPGFAALSEDFLNRYGELVEALRGSGNDDPKLLRVTIDYENYLDLFDSNLVSKRLVAEEKISASDRNVFSPGTTAVRKHVQIGADQSSLNLLIGVEPTRRGEGLSFALAQPLDTPGDGVNASTILALSARADLGKGDEPGERLNSAHEAINEIFAGLFDDSFKSSWGEK
ncbi:TIGR04255 family protein [Amycolatopsis rhabdoformis]|uniref:TIGR04255 family protein n=1 Tax=Amycolatopsis rhabdoformis TaxID=1448059 RepID=A0ABZ1I2P5_9PSEU|nr:TIGR04255 family protein [Amycolatopsis rhabdoformis]WSE27925.1 TIGR04255 family protein [Amycolatopsis rhabdoformis]